jgi:hypothetical protein
MNDLPEPQHGGSYIRNEDGSLTLLERTEPALARPSATPSEPVAADVQTTEPPSA